MVNLECLWQLNLSPKYWQARRQFGKRGQEGEYVFVNVSIPDIKAGNRIKGEKKISTYTMATNSHNLKNLKLFIQYKEL